MLHKTLSALAVVVLTVHLASGQDPGGTVPGLTALDYTQIEMLYARNNLGMDSGGDDGYILARTFTSDGELLNQDGTTVGHEALAELAIENQRGLRHWISNLMIQPSPEGAVGWAYILQIDSRESGDGQGGAGARSSVTEGGLYHDVIVKTADGWRFKKRTYIGGHGMPERAQSALIPIDAVRARPGGTRPGPLTALDYTEIKRLVGQYNLGYDSTAATDDGAMVGLAFTPDAFFERAGSDNPWRGRQAIVDASARPRLGIHHWVSNLLIDPTPDGAASWSYLLLFTVNDDGTVVRERGGGILHETYTRTAEGWQIKYRRYDALGSTTAIGWPSPQFGHFVDALAPEPAPDDTMPPHLSSRDHVEIEQLYIRNNIAFDSVADDGQAFARTFTLDGALVAPTGTVTGHERLAARAAQHTPGLHTWMSNLIIEASSEGATGSVYILTADMTGRETQGAVVGGGLSQDVLVKTAEGWRFKQRTYTPSTADLTQAWSAVKH